jgi:hypothetical protein
LGDSEVLAIMRTLADKVRTYEQIVEVSDQSLDSYEVSDEGYLVVGDCSAPRARPFTARVWFVSPERGCSRGYCGSPEQSKSIPGM